MKDGDSPSTPILDHNVSVHGEQGFPVLFRVLWWQHELPGIGGECVNDYWRTERPVRSYDRQGKTLSEKIGRCFLAVPHPGEFLVASDGLCGLLLEFLHDAYDRTLPEQSAVE